MQATRLIAILASLVVSGWPAGAGADPSPVPASETAAIHEKPAPSPEADATEPELQDALEDALDVDLSTLIEEPVKASRLPQPDIAASKWQRAERPDGTTRITVNKPLPLSWDTRIGADLNPAGQINSDPARQPLPVLENRGTAAAWAKVAVPNIAAVELRMNSEQDRNKFGATLSRTMPLGERYAVTFENSVVVSDPLGGHALPASVAPARSWNTDRVVKFSILGSGTTLAAGTTTSTLDNITRGKLIAEQTIYGPLNVSTALTDLGTPTEAKSISAGFKLNW